MDNEQLAVKDDYLKRNQNENNDLWEQED